MRDTLEDIYSDDARGQRKSEYNMEKISRVKSQGNYSYISGTVCNFIVLSSNWNKNYHKSLLTTQLRQREIY